MSDSVLTVFLSCRFLVFFGADVAKSQVMTTCSLVGRSSVLTIGFPVSLEAFSMPTRGAGMRYSSITIKVYSVRIDKGLSSNENRCLHFGDQSASLCLKFQKISPSGIVLSMYRKQRP